MSFWISIFQVPLDLPLHIEYVTWCLTVEWFVLFLDEYGDAPQEIRVCVRSAQSNFIQSIDWMKFELLLKDVRTNCFCASLLRMAACANSHATSCIERARQVLKRTMIGQMAIAITLLGFNDLGRSVTPTFLFRNRFYLQLSPHCSNMNKKSMWEVKKILRFLFTGYGILPSCGCKASETLVSKCELILWGLSPVD